jgi:hypothetical protein
MPMGRSIGYARYAVAYPIAQHTTIYIYKKKFVMFRLSRNLKRKFVYGLPCECRCREMASSVMVKASE